jgi:hypothetical protein
MLRRTLRIASFVPPDPDTDPALHYSPFHWNYLLPQTMIVPQTQNQRGPARRRKRLGRKFNGVWVDTEMHPAFRVALQPWLRKLALTRFVPPTKPTEAVADYSAHSKMVGDQLSRHGWLAKVIQLCAMHKSASEPLALWSEDCHALYVTGNQIPPAPLAIAMVYATAAAGAPEWRSFFRCCLKGKWNLTPRFPMPLWNNVLQHAGEAEDEEAVLEILDEMIDLQVHLDAVSAHAYVHAFNAVRSKPGYERVKKLLFLLCAEKATVVSRAYAGLRTRVELEQENAPKLKDNDEMFYHLHWHQSIRNPLRFLPRRLYFDYKPGAAIDTKVQKKSVDTLVAERLQKWKEQGLVPDDYEDSQKVDDISERFKFWRRQEKWKKKPTFIEKHAGYTPYEAAK